MGRGLLWICLSAAAGLAAVYSGSKAEAARCKEPRGAVPTCFGMQMLTRVRIETASG